MNFQSFKISSREITFGKLLKSQYELLPFVALCNLIAKMHNASKFWSMKFMDADFFIILFMIDLYEYNHVHTCIHKIFLLKTSPQTIDWIFTKFHRNVP